MIYSKIFWPYFTLNFNSILSQKFLEIEILFFYRLNITLCYKLNNIDNFLNILIFQITNHWFAK